MMRRRLRQVVVFGALALAACGSSKPSTNTDADLAAVGRLCEQGTTGPDSGNAIAFVISPALECPSRMCLFAAEEKTGSRATPLCTEACTSDADCARGERGDPNDPADKHCKGGFACMIPTTVGNFACQKLCTCIDTLIVPAGGFQKPAVCA